MAVVAHGSRAGAESAVTLPTRPKRAALTGWGRYPQSAALVYRPEKVSELADIIRGQRSIVARGAGKAYGDAALNDDGVVLDIQRLDRMLSFDEKTGVLRCEAGVTIADLLATLLRRGFFPPVTPGTKFVTLGGSLAADIHGKNHHRDSSLAAHVLNLDLMVASGEVVRCSRETNSDLFWATVGGMGLTGVIVELELSLKPVESAYIVASLVPFKNIDQAIEIFEEADRKFQYSAAWFDSLSSGGRGVVHLGNFASLGDLDRQKRQDPFNAPARLPLAVPFDLPNLALNALSVRCFNSLYYRAHRPRQNAIVPYESFFYPLDSVSGWNRIYGKRGFVQYQCVWPLEESRRGLLELLQAITRSRIASFLTVLKKFGPQEGLLSFPMPGYTLALDFPVRTGLFEFLDRLDSMVLERGGRVYLAKDARLRPQTFQKMYPGFSRWREIKRAVDPAGVFSSTLSRRLRMDYA